MSNDEQLGEVTEEDESYDAQTGKPKKEKRFDILKALSDLIPSFLQSKHIKDLSGFTDDAGREFCAWIFGYFTTFYSFSNKTCGFND